MISVPEITKSGINHRMKKLMLLGKELLKNPDLK
jgi:DNA-binding transcriptional regulator WhiA